MTQAWQVAPTNNYRELERSIKRLQFVNGIRYLSLPVAAIGAGIGAAVAPVAFPIAAGAAAIAVGISEVWARRERAHLDATLKALESQHVISAEEAKEFTATANTVTVAGSSSSS